MHTKQPDIQTQPEQPKQPHQHGPGFTTSTKFMLLQLRQRKSWSIHFQTSQISTNFVHFIHYQFYTFHRSPNICTWLAQQFRTFHPSLHESVTKVNRSVYTASRTYRFCWQYAIMLAWKAWSSLNHLNYRV